MVVKIGIAADHGGFDMKEFLCEALKADGHQITDFGAQAFQTGDDYPDFSVPLAEAVARGDLERGVALCGSGVGVCVAANKIPGIRAGMCHDTYSAHQGVEHDDMNVCVLGARIIGPALAFEVVDRFIAAKFIATEERFVRRFKKVLAIEAKYQREDGPAKPA
jgi:ribose 5-phosphate isomerase B